MIRGRLRHAQEVMRGLAGVQVLSGNVSGTVRAERLLSWGGAASGWGRVLRDLEPAKVSVWISQHN